MNGELDFPLYPQNNVQNRKNKKNSNNSSSIIRPTFTKTTPITNPFSIEKDLSTSPIPLEKQYVNKISCSRVY